MVISGNETNEQVLEELGKRIRQVRLAMDLTQGELAEKADVSLVTVSSIERGNSITCNNLFKIVRAMGMLSNLNVLIPEPIIKA